MKELNRFREFLNEGAFGDKAKVALENRLTGMAKAMVEDGDLFAEGGNVTYDEKDLKDGATPEQIEAIDQIKTAVIEMGGRVNYGVSDEDGTLTYMYLVVDEPPTYDAVLKVITKENNEPNLFRSVFKENEVEPQTDLIGIAAHTLKDMSAEEAIDAIDRLMLYLKDAKADIEYKNQ